MNSIEREQCVEFTYFCKGTRKGLELSICSTVEVEIRENLDIQTLAHGLVLVKIDFQEQDLGMLLCRSAELMTEYAANQLTVIQITVHVIVVQN